MAPIEIRYNKIKLVSFIFAFSLFIVMVAYVSLFTTSLNENAFVKYGLLYPIILFLCYAIYVQIKRMVKDYAVITITETSIELNTDGKLTVFYWPEVKEIKIERLPSTKNQIYSLRVISETQNKRVSLSSLEKSADEVRELIKPFQKIV